MSQLKFDELFWDGYYGVIIFMYFKTYHLLNILSFVKIKVIGIYFSITLVLSYDSFQAGTFTRVTF